ncbi:MAG TPA: ABC transporter ATP-binding protein [Acidobacteriaceae bacterium]|nr:ABC transporter ATP-binding protein [Acidobacteriaceae bacterium]
MADPKQSTPQQDDDVIGKAYDSRLMRRLLVYLKPYRLQVGISLVAILFTAFADVLGPYLTKVAVDLYMTPSQGTSHSLWTRHLSHNPMTGITEIAGMYLGSLIFIYVLAFIQTYLMQWTGQKVMYDLRSQIFRHIQRMHVAFFDRNPTGRLVTRVTYDVDALNEMFTSGVVSIFEDVLVLAGIVFVMLRMNWWLALLAFSVIPLIMIATQIFRKFVRESYRRIRTAIARINSYLQEHVSGMSVVQLFNREERAFQDFEKVNRQHMKAFKDAIMAYALYYPVVEILSSIAVAIIIWVGGGGVLRGVVTLGVLVAFIQYSQRFFRPIQDLSDKYNILQAAMAASERIFKLLDTPPEIVSPPNPAVGDGSGRIEFRHVWFTYQRMDDAMRERLRTSATPEKEDVEWVLRDVSFTIEPGETAAIVGHTGAGKTTLSSLMMRFYDVQRGAILIEGIDVRDWDVQELRRRFAVVLQDPVLFTGTVTSNIRLGTERITEEEIESAADQVNVGDYIRSLPDGFQEPVREGGSTLSTGQKQLINFARALAHNPRILILDEATSSVDTETELRVRSALTRLVTGRTSVIVAHRLSTIQTANRILVMHKGQLREIGTHQELLAQRGLYWKLYRLQYKDQEIPDAIIRSSDPLAVTGD